MRSPVGLGNVEHQAFDMKCKHHFVIWRLRYVGILKWQTYRRKALNPNIEQQIQISETELKRYLIKYIDFYYLKSNKNILISFRESL